MTQMFSNGRSHCDCDHDFYKCLKESNNSFAYTIGNFYFNILKVHCLKEEQKVVCVKKRFEIQT